MICYVSQDDIKYLLRLLKTELSLPPNLDNFVDWTNLLVVDMRYRD